MKEKIEIKLGLTFYDGKNNIAIQNEIVDSILKSGNADLIIANLADISESAVENIILRVKPRNVPLIILNVDPQVLPKVSQYYNRVVFIRED